MKILVCVKRILDTAVKVKISSDGKKIDKSDAEYVLSPYDEIAVEHAIRIKEKIPNTEVIILTLGINDAEKNIRTTLAMGADRAILLEGNPDTFESFAIAKALAEAIKIEKPDMVLTGVKSSDNENSQVGPMIASLLEMPFISTATSLEINDNKVKAESEMEGYQLLLEASFPCVISIQKSNVDPRICSLINIRKAKTKELKKSSVSLTPEQWQIIKVALPAERKGGKIVGQGIDAVPKLFELLRQEAKVL